MLENMSIFQLASGLAQHASARHAVVARNLANKDTPGFQAREIESFAKIAERGRTANNATAALKTSREKHVAGSGLSAAFQVHSEKNLEQKPNGNTVSLENETLKAIEAERAHSRALAIYQSSLNILKTSIGRGR